MGKKVKKSLEKRKHPADSRSTLEDEAAAAKKQKPDQKKIVDLDDDCLFEILKLLDLYDLTNAAGANRRFEAIARDVFAKKYAKRVICVSNKENANQKTLPSVDMLKRFGDLTTKLHVKYSPGEHCVEINGKIENAIAKNCEKALLEIHITGADKFAFLHTKKPFSNVNKVVFNKGIVHRLIKAFNYLFPTAERLDLVNIEMGAHHTQCIEKSFPAVKHLRLVNVKGYGIYESVQSTIAQNPQIVDLHISTERHHPPLIDEHNSDMLRDVRQAEDERFLRSVLSDENGNESNIDDSSDSVDSFWDESDDDLDLDERIFIDNEFIAHIHQHLKDVQTLSLENRHLEETSTPLNFTSLKRLTLQFAYSETSQIGGDQLNELVLLGGRLDAPCSTLIKQSPNVSKLQIIGYWSSSESIQQMTEAIKGLPKIHEIDICNGIGYFDDDYSADLHKKILSLLGNCKFLARLRFTQKIFTIGSTKQYNDFAHQIHNAFRIVKNKARWTYTLHNKKNDVVALFEKK